MLPSLRVWIPRGCALLAFAAYAWLAAPGPYWLDSQELGAAAVRLGVAHPTGFPLLLFLGKIASFLPFGELAYRVHLLSALSAALAVGVAAAWVIELGGGDVPSLFGGAAAAVALGAALTFFRQATVTEVYAPTAALLLVAMRAGAQVAAGAGARVALPLALLAGVGAVGAHGSFRLLLIVPFVVLYLVRYFQKARFPLVAPLLVALGAGGIAAYLPLRAASGRIAGLDWGHTVTGRATLDHMNAGRFRRAYAPRMIGGAAWQPAPAARAIAGQIEGDLGVVALVAAAGGLAALGFRRGRRGAGIILLAVAAGDLAYAVALNPMGIDDRQCGVPFLCAAAVLAGVGAAAAGRRLGGRAAPFAAAVAGACLVVQPVLAGGAEKLAVADAPRAYAESALERCPPRAVAIVSSDSMAGLLIWFTLAEPARPDVAVLVEQHLGDEQLARDVLALTGTTGSLPASGRPLRREISEFAPPRGYRFVPDVPIGYLVREGAAAPAPEPRRTLAALDRVFDGRALDDEDARHVAERAFANASAIALDRRDPQAASVAAVRALALDADDPFALANGARARVLLGDPEGARPLAERAVHVAPRTASAWALLGVIDANAGRCAQAAGELDRALALDPAQPDATAARPRLSTECRPR